MSRSHSPLKDVISTVVVSIDPKDTLRHALTLMVENRVSALPVVDAEKSCVGVISVSDLMGITKDLSDELNSLPTAGRPDYGAFVEKLRNADSLKEVVQDWMTPDLVSVGIECSIEHAAKHMLRNQVHRLMVLDNQRRMVGVVSALDLLAAFVDKEGG